MALDQIYKNVLEGNAPGVKEEVRKALESGQTADVILKEGLISAMSEVGQRFEAGDYFVPEMLVAARAMKTGVEVLKPLFQESGIEPVGKVVIGTVLGDLHDIGKNLVGLMLEGAGFEVVDIGVDLPAEEFVNAVKKEKPDVLGLSALLTTTIPNVGDVTKALTEAGIRDSVKVIIGGASMTEDHAGQFGADGYGADAASSVKMTKDLLGITE